MKFLGIDHIEIIVRDLEQQIAWYQMLGFELVRRTSHHGASAELKFPGDGDQPIIELHQVAGEENVGVNHIAYRVDDADAFAEHAEANGLKLEAGPTFYEPTGRTLANFRDPDGWRMQVVSRKPKS
ncbi:MAG: VOC family protein [Deltaproteobacteria bacterium]|jgi:glyoxylase I family protein